MEDQSKELDGKILSLKLSLGKNDQVIASNNIEAISRHEALIMSKIQSIHTVKEAIVEPKIYWWRN